MSKYDLLVGAWVRICNNEEEMKKLLLRTDEPPEIVKLSFALPEWRIELAIRRRQKRIVDVVFNDANWFQRVASLSKLMGILCCARAIEDAVLVDVFAHSRFWQKLHWESFALPFICYTATTSLQHHLSIHEALARAKRLVSPSYHGIFFDYVFKHALTIGASWVIRELGDRQLISRTSFVAERVFDDLLDASEDMNLDQDALRHVFQRKYHRFRACMPVALNSRDAMFQLMRAADGDTVFYLINNAYTSVVTPTDEIRMHFCSAVRSGHRLVVEWLIRKYGDRLLTRDDGVPIDWRAVIFKSNSSPADVADMVNLLVRLGFPLDLESTSMGLFEYLYAPCDGSSPMITNRLSDYPLHAKEFMELLMALDVYPRCRTSLDTLVPLMKKNDWHMQLAFLASTLPLPALRTMHAAAMAVAESPERFPSIDDDVQLRDVARRQIGTALNMHSTFDVVEMHGTIVEHLQQSLTVRCEQLALNSWIHYWRDICIEKACALAWLDFPVLVTIEIFDAMAPPVIRKHLRYAIKWNMFRAIKDKICRREGRIR